MRAIQITEFGGPEVLTPAELPDPEAGAGQVVIHVDAAGVNYSDTHQAENSYLAPTRLPLVPGSEVVGFTADGRRVVALLAGGGYAEQAVAAEATTFDVPDGVEDGQALALVLQGLTAWHILRTSARLVPGETVVVHAGAGGVGSLAVQLARAWGAGRVIASASSEDKRDLARSLGADVAIDSRAPDMNAALRAANDGRKVDVVLEMAGGRVFDGSLAAIAPFGRLVTYGSAGREPASPVNPGSLLRHSSAVIGFWLAHCFGRPELLADPLAELFAMTAEGRLRPVIGGSYALEEARQAHLDIRGRATVGKLLLTP